MENYKILVVRENQTFADDVEAALKSKSPDAQVISVPAVLRAVGAVGMLKPTHVLVDIDTRNISDSVDKIVEAGHQVGATIIFDSTVNPAAAEKLADAKSVRAFDGNNGDRFAQWILNDMPELGADASPGTSNEKSTDGASSGSTNSSPNTTPNTVTPSGPPIYVPLESPGYTRDGQRIPSIDELLLKMLEAGGSDLHITTGSSPRYRIRGELIAIPNTPRLLPEDCEKMILQIVEEKRLREFEETHELDYSYSIPGKSRFRVNVFRQRGGMASVLRTIPYGIPTLEQLGLPDVCRELAGKPRGLVLVTGPTGSGKSTTLAAMIDWINENKAVHIMTMEDPIEFMHRNKKALINQREIGEDTMSFASALKRVLRQDPDVILVGEMRDLETISAAITAAETGHLVFGTLHTIGGPETVDRIIDVFAPEQQSQIRLQLSNSLQGVLSQVLCPTADGKSRVVAFEIMLGIPSIANLIREGKTHQMPSIIQSSGGLGMTTLDQSLRKLASSGKITIETAIEKSQDPKAMAESLGRAF